MFWFFFWGRMAGIAMRLHFYELSYYLYSVSTRAYANTVRRDVRRHYDI